MHPKFERADHFSEKSSEQPSKCIAGSGPDCWRAFTKNAPIHKAQLLSYMKLLDIPLGLLINFHNVRLTDGVSRLLLPGANR